ncbi:MAG: hemerythrin domain-containing protein [Nanoarchaeota archaeon]|nr:hemerythrin domain-containing protein [Nanoarchaeota archaeon]MBU1051915.1 hemerythrin domain-containing protein [Nanoarchaeota archaeon]
MKNSITEIMLREHKRIDAMIEEVEKTLPDFEKARQIFNKFKWNLEKHFFVEEKVIFSAYSSTTSNESEDIFTILKEHKDILWSMKKIEQSLSKNLQPNFSNIKKDLKDHVNFEDRIFYPRLDEELDDNLKEVMIDRAKEVIKE